MRGLGLAQRSPAAQLHWLAPALSCGLQFCDWVQQQWQKKPGKFWSSGLHDYLRHQAKIRREFADVIEEGEVAEGWAGGERG